jgi:hypothetical protein
MHGPPRSREEVVSLVRDHIDRWMAASTEQAVMLSASELRADPHKVATLIQPAEDRRS